MKYFLVIWLIVFLIFYFMNGNKAKAVSNHKIDFEVIESKYFKGFEPVYKPAIIRSNNAMATIRIKKNKLSKKKMEEIEVKIMKDGWKKIDEFESYKVYCANRNQSLIIFFPSKMNERARNNQPIFYNDINEWPVFLYYDDIGDDCAKF